MWRASKTPTHAKMIGILCDALAKHAHLPKQCDIASIGPLHMAALYDEFRSDQLFADTVYCGMDTDKDIAILKALVECSERLAFHGGVLKRDPNCMTDRSDGIAAFPIIGADVEKARQSARANAYAEALERYVWSTWWDDRTIKFTVKDAAVTDSQNARGLMAAIGELTAIQNWIEVRPEFVAEGLDVAIVFAQLTSGGVISGGAAGTSGNETVRLRALGELARHAAGVEKLKTGAKTESFYERRLAYMATAAAGNSLQERLSQSGDRSIHLPPLAIDAKIDHSLRDFVCVHRCLFENQPPFVGGALERLCL